MSILRLPKEFSIEIYSKMADTKQRATKSHENSAGCFSIYITQAKN